MNWNREDSKHKMLFEFCSSIRFLIFIIVHLCNPLHFPEMLCRWSKAGLWWQPRGRGFWNAFCFQLTEEDKIQQSTFPMSRYFREGWANIFVPFYIRTKTSGYFLSSCWQTWNLSSSQTFLILRVSFWEALPESFKFKTSDAWIQENDSPFIKSYRMEVNKG